MQHVAGISRVGGTCAGAALAALVGCCFAVPAAAGEPRVFGVGKPGVEIDYGALDALPVQRTIADHYRAANHGNPALRRPSRPPGSGAPPLRRSSVPRPIPGPAPVAAVRARAAAASAAAASPAKPEPAAPAAGHAATPVALPTRASIAAGDAVRILFATGQSRFGDTGTKLLDRVAEAMAGDESARAQLHAYARDADRDSDRARRLSLIRALSVRSYLMRSGVSSTRIDLRALGPPIGSGPADRVDIHVRKR